MRHQQSPNLNTYFFHQVKVGQVQVVQWTIDTIYSEISIPQGSGLLFQWSGPTFHDLVEMSSPQSTSQDCTFVGSTAQSLGKVRIRLNVVYYIATTIQQKKTFGTKK